MENEFEIYDLITQKLPHHPSESKHGIWVSGSEEIMVDSEDKANMIADILEDLDYDIAHTYHYNDIETDGLNYGWWSVYIDGM